MRLRAPHAVARWLAVAAVVVAWCGAAVPALAAEVTVGDGAVSARLTDTGGEYEAGETTLEVTRGGTTTTFAGLEGDREWRAAPSSPLTVTDLDADGEDEVVARLDSRGAHCCARSAIAHWDARAATYRISLHDWWDASWRLGDRDGDGVAELRSWDARWSYWGTDFATSGRPLQIWQWDGAAGALVDRTAAFRSEVATDMRRQWRLFRDLERRGYGTRGALAAYIADSYVAGVSEGAWRRAYAAYQRAGRARFFRALGRRLATLGYRAASDPIPPLPPLRAPARWRSCSPAAPEVGFVAGLRARGVGCGIARGIADELAPGGEWPATSLGFTCVGREVSIETIRVRCARGPYENVRFWTGV
jgi:hypothetical protein